MPRFGVVKLARPGLHAVLLAGVIVALGLAGLKADGASAAVLCNGGNILGEGSLPQGIANQNVWIPAFEGEVCNSGAHPKVEYGPQGDVAGLVAWGAFGGAINRTRAFIGTDDAPTAAQIANIKAAAGVEKAHVLVIPVAQTSIAAVVNPPAGCTVENLTNEELEESFRGVVLEWSELENTVGGEACESPLTRVVPLDASGIAAQFKSYLYLQNGALLPCPVKGGAKLQTWRELSPVSETGAPNTGWPETCMGGELATVVRPEEGGDGAEVRKVNATPASIGFAALPDVEANEGQFIALQNNGTASIEEATYASPQILGSEKGKGAANCGATKYLVPAEGRLAGTGLDVDWSQVFGGDPAIGGSAYPLCALTYDLAFKGYKEAGFTFASYQTVRDFLNGYVVFGGQTALVTSETNYALLPETKGMATNNVIAAARHAAALISQ